MFRRNPIERLSQIASTQRRREDELAWLIQLYLEKAKGQGMADREAAERLYLAIAEGRSFRDELGEPDAAAGFSPIEHARMVAASVLATEMHRGEPPAVTEARTIRGLAISPRIAFGEVVRPTRADVGGRGDALLALLDVRCIHPDLWPGQPHQEPTPKILVVNNDLYEFARENGNLDLLAQAAGVISLDSYMGSHLSHFLRNVAVGGISVALRESDIADAKFALIDGERLHIFNHRPNLVAEDVDRLARAARRNRGFSD